LKFEVEEEEEEEEEISDNIVEMKGKEFVSISIYMPSSKSH